MPINLISKSFKDIPQRNICSLIPYNCTCIHFCLFSVNKNYIALLSHRVSIFQKKIRIFSEKEVRSRLILYFSYEFSKTKETSFLLNHTKTEIADMIGVARPSVSRELKHMEEDGLIIMDRNLITIKEPNIFHFEV